MIDNFDEDRYHMLRSAIAKKVEIEEDMAGQIAWRLLNYFGFEDDIIDNVLDQDDRRMFYFLQDLELLKTAWEEAVLPSGRTWRIFYWSLNKEHIFSYASVKEKAAGPEPGVYESLPQDVWSRDAETGEARA
jgi:hypothetical protein